VGRRKHERQVAMSTKAKPVASSQKLHVHGMDAVIASPPMYALLSLVERVAMSSAAVLITGETGTGKEVVARAIHAHSARAACPWVDVNCGALPEHLVESELFGYEKGAFSGADEAKPGLFELADKGTLLLDEVGELEPKIQVKLLRVLDGAPFYRLGGTSKITVDVRIIAATNQPLETAVKTGRFRSDLYHRLRQLQIRVPPLRERVEDIAVLASHFLRQNHPVKSFSFEAMGTLQNYSWPGNVRELRNVVLQAATNAREPEITLADLPSEVLPAADATAEPRPFEPALPNAVEDMEKQVISRALVRTAGHQGMAAAQLGISRRTLCRKLKQYRIDHRSLAAQDSGETKYFRLSIALPVSVVSRHGEQIGISVNVSEGGIAVDGIQEPFQLAGPLTIGFTISEEELLVTARALIVWADAHGRVGFRFTRVNEACRLQFREWLRCKEREQNTPV
jgi:DNA-binding NtrC family response regulator